MFVIGTSTDEITQTKKFAYQVFVLPFFVYQFHLTPLTIVHETISDQQSVQNRRSWREKQLVTMRTQSSKNWLTRVAFPHMEHGFSDPGEPQGRTVSISSTNIVTTLRYRKLFVHSMSGQHAYIELLSHCFFKFRVKASNTISFVHFCNEQ